MADQGGLVIIIDDGVETVSLTDERGTELAITEWDASLPFIQQYRLIAGTYELHLQGPIETVTVSAADGLLTYLRLSPYRIESEIVGIQLASWMGGVTPEAERLVEWAVERGFEGVLYPQLVIPAGDVLYLNTDPPWKIPPPPER